ncbi:MAG: UDP-glucose/GDP-mannose dehydrogenase [marine bacterium B5-7]|nr:MAG: UDP-glucose/GDP-mannose dehydrogenase [marine bacterium B5-7]
MSNANQPDRGDLSDVSVAIVGLGYVGLPLALAFGCHVRVIGYDQSKERVEQCLAGTDIRGESNHVEFRTATKLRFTCDVADCANADFILIVVPTPVDSAKRPDFTPLVQASEAIGSILRKGTTVIYESTVYPGATEEKCIPVLENASGLKWKEDFHVAYSPERVNPGDKEHTLEKIKKIVAADDAATLKKVSRLYSTIIEAGICEVESIRVAEAAKVIENTQRDLNIALINEFAVLFDKLDIDTRSVLDAAATKWNFLPFKPGLVGGHCIGVDPYYLTYKAQMVGYHPEIILAGRRINDQMGNFVATKTIKLMLKSKIPVDQAKIAILGLTFKENCSDLRNSKVIDVFDELQSYSPGTVLIHDPLASDKEITADYGVAPSKWEDIDQVDVIVLAVAHEFYKNQASSVIAEKLTRPGVVIDVKAAFARDEFIDSGLTYWNL